MFHVTKLYTSNYFVKIFFITFCGIIYPIFLKYNNLTFFWAFRLRLQLRRRAFRYIFSRLRFRLRLQLRLQKDAAPIPNAKGELKIEKECHFTSSTLLVVLLSCCPVVFTSTQPSVSFHRFLKRPSTYIHRLPLMTCLIHIDLYRHLNQRLSDLPYYIQKHLSCLLH